jgi:hypothetical protein
MLHHLNSPTNCSGSCLADVGNKGTDVENAKALVQDLGRKDANCNLQGMLTTSDGRSQGTAMNQNAMVLQVVLMALGLRIFGRDSFLVAMYMWAPETGVS